MTCQTCDYNAATTCARCADNRVRAAVLAERERCAALVESTALNGDLVTRAANMAELVDSIREAP